VIKIVLQHGVTRLYLKTLEQWPCHWNDAFDFEAFERAVKFACEHSLSKMRVTVVFSETGDVKAIPMEILAPDFPGFPYARNAKTPEFLHSPRREHGLFCIEGR
jgi:hypothetical protein